MLASSTALKNRPKASGVAPNAGAAAAVDAHRGDRLLAQQTVCGQLERRVRLVDRADPLHAVAEALHDTDRVLREARRRVGRSPAPIADQPARAREVVQRDDRRHAVGEAAVDHARVVVERGDRDEALFGLDAGPFDAEAECVQAERGDGRHIVGIAVVEVARVAARLPEHRVRQVLEHPDVARDVSALDLMSRGGRTPQKPLGKADRGGPVHDASVLSGAPQAIRRGHGTAMDPSGRNRRLTHQVGAIARLESHRRSRVRSNRRRRRNRRCRLAGLLRLPGDTPEAPGAMASPDTARLAPTPSPE
jgi:hypothetical protein